MCAAMDEVSGARLGSLGGTSIYVQISFVILAALFVVLDLERGYTIERALLWIPVLFLSVLFHELGHASVIGLFRFGPSVIILGGFGGVTINARKSKPWQEILISAAGPLSSIALALLLSLAFMTIAFLRSDRMMSELIPRMVWANYAWAIFNLMPIYPLDGGQISKNLARFVTSREKAIRFSAISSLVLAIAITVFAVISRSFFLAAIAGMLAIQNYQRLQTGDAEL
jgi:stage IV sporulation protein FB